MTLADAFLHLATPLPALFLVAGVFLGIMVGVMPGVTAGMMMALVLPFTYHMTSQNAVILLMGLFVGGFSGGLITATLMRVPGEPNALMTCLDGYALARKGFPGRALGLGNAASIVGGALSWLVLVLLAPPLAAVAVYFGPFENFALVVTALVLIASLSEGSFLKGLSSGLLGMLVAMPGIDETSGMVRLTFGVTAFEGGFNVLPVILGMFAVGQVLADAVNIDERMEALEASTRGIFISLRDYAVHGWTMLRSSAIGVAVGILPGIGSTISSIAAYTTARNLSPHPERFGQGSEEAIVAAESANNATTGGTLVPLLTLGIPGGVTDTILLSALVIHNLQPGPLLYRNNPEVVNAIMASHLVAHGVMFLLMTLGIGLFARMMRIPRAYVLPLVVVFCVIGAFALNNRLFDVWLMLAFGAVGFGLELAKVPLAPFIVGLVLAPVAEAELRAGLMASGGSLAPLVNRPVALSLLLVAAALFVWPFLRARRRPRTPEV